VAPDVTGWNATTSFEPTTHPSTYLTSITGSDNPARADLPSAGNYLNAEVRVGVERKHVETLRKDWLENAIQEYLKQSCPLADSK
jgi:hypothetical protein